MNIISKILLLVLLSILLLLIVFLVIKVRKNKMNSKSTSNYKKVVDVRNLVQLKEYFLWDNPRENGEDPTGGMVDYGYGMEKNSDGTIIKNINGDISWGEIKDNATSKELISEDKGFIRINLAKSLSKNKNKNVVVGAPRLISRQLFRGGLFIFDVEHVPIGCAVWPALWLNGFIAAPDQYHQNEEGPTYKDDLQKLANTTLGTKELYSSHVCKDKNDGIDGREDRHLTKFTGSKIYPMEWPGGGEVDIVEQTNFSPTNLVSIHGGPNCQVSSYVSDIAFSGEPIYGQENNLIRSVCGGKACNSDEFDDGIDYKTSKCPRVSVYNAGNSQINVQNGFGEKFNNTKGGVYATQWIPKEKIYVWFFPRELFSEEYLKKNNGPLSDNPDPDNWPIHHQIENSKRYYRTLVASYQLNNEDAITSGCDLNFQSIIINITLGGGWAGSVMNQIPYCSVDNKSEWADYVTKCFTVDPTDANKNPEGAWDPKTGCYDGGKAPNHRGVKSKAMFYSEAYFLIRSIKVFQNDKVDQKVW